MPHNSPAPIGETDESISWLSYDEVAALLGVSRARVKRLVEDRALGSRLEDGQRRVPDVFLRDGQPVQHLRGTLIALHDAGYDDDQACTWMLTPNDVVEETPINALRHSRKTAVRQAIQFLAF